MERNWLILILVFMAIITLFIFFIIRNQKDKKALIHELNEDDKLPIQEEHDTDVNTLD